MDSSNPSKPESLNEAKLPRQDWILLPLLSLLTICFIAVFMESIARCAFSTSKQTVNDCMVLTDSSTGIHAIPNSVCLAKTPESRLIEYRFNRCGHRTEMECGPKTPGSYRIVVVGSSIAMGTRVQEESDFAELLPKELLLQAGRKIELYNAAVHRQRPAALVLQFNEVLAVQPDAILWTLSPLDIHDVSEVALSQGEAKQLQGGQGFITKNIHRFANSHVSFSGAVRLFKDSRTALLIQHFLYQSQSQYIKSYLRAEDSEAGYLKANPSAEWQNRMQQIDGISAILEGKAKAAGIPFIAVLIPSRAQAAMASMGKWPPNCDPYKLDGELRSIIVSHGGIYIDILPEFRNLPAPEQYYFPVDGHPNAAGHAVIAEFLAKELARGALPALHAGSIDQASSKQE